MKQFVNRIRAGGAKPVLVIGDVMLDEYFFGSVNRISPEAPVPVLKEERQEWCLGGAANVAANCRHIGCDVSLVGLIGMHDSEGQRLLSLVQDFQISPRGLIQTPHRPTTSKKRFLAKNHQMLRMDTETAQCLNRDEYRDITQRIDTLMVPSSIVLLSDYAKGVLTSELIGYVCTRARERNCMVMVDPKGPDFAKYRGVDYVKPNLKEFGQMVDFFGLSSDQSLEKNGKEICRLLALKGLIVTEGERGITYVSGDRTIFSPACQREVYDLTGAGDTVFAFVALGLAHGFSMEECLLVANRAAAVAVSHLKTYAVSLDELVDRSTDSTEKIYTDWMQLKIELDWLRSEKKKVVVANGSFDILHSGHIHTLKEAKKCGDILVVALNTDESVKRYKGPSRPVNSLAHRALVISALGMVDFVVSFAQDTPRSLIEYLKPDVLVKGGDYQKERVAGYDIVTSYGGEVHIVDYLSGFSTTSLIKQIEQQKTGAV
ncbi:MAG: D-glycero-beta-D-manno-heptose 1-phosphate adenylyltransferase [Candidatus Babeliales bacterium]|jgi:D-beta-D-heptose 7-phosphate kinase/D-beta-D-heptose 1-phosphate adenosyltransferase